MGGRKQRSGKNQITDRLRNLSYRIFEEDEIKLDPNQEYKDKLILKFFPLFIVVCIIVWIVSLIYQNEYSLALMIQLLCLVFTTLFALLGIPCFIVMERGKYSKFAIILINTVFSLIIWEYMHHTQQPLFDKAVIGVLGALNLEISGICLNIASFLAIFMLFTFTTVGVLTVMCAYLRNYVVNVLTNMENHAVAGIRGKAEKFFMIPEIIDVERIDLEPIIYKDRFDNEGFKSLTTYIIIMGFTISSYMFVNPYFLDSFSWKMLLAIMLLLSMFIPCLIIPWQLFKTLGAKAVSDGNRDYYLWSGAKNRLFTSFLALSSFSMMFLLSLYFGHDVSSILFNYLAYLLPLVFIACSISFIYTNNFSLNLNKSIFVKYYEKNGQIQRQDKVS